MAPLGTVNVDGAIAIAEDGMLIQDLNITTDLGEVRGGGELRHNGRVAATGSAESPQIELHGKMDLAAVASACATQWPCTMTSRSKVET